VSTASARLSTSHGSRYLQQLCKHWSHKFPVTFTPENGRIELPMGVCILDADAEGLGLLVDTAADTLKRMEDVVADHLKRFAFREELQFHWVETA
jgi:hypothetical protein